LQIASSRQIAKASLILMLLECGTGHYNPRPELDEALSENSG
jgi:hypothetical protein